MRKSCDFYKMGKSNTTNMLLRIDLLAIITFALLGCATPRVAVNPDLTEEDYK